MSSTETILGRGQVVGIPNENGEIKPAVVVEQYGTRRALLKDGGRVQSNGPIEPLNLSLPGIGVFGMEKIIEKLDERITIDDIPMSRLGRLIHNIVSRF